MKFLLLFLLFWLIFFRPLFLFGDTSYIIVIGDSMEPTLYQGDFVMAKVSSDYRVGDIIAYEKFNSTVVHRIVDITEEGFITKGDNNPDPDPWVVKKDEILGKYLLSIPRFGEMISYMKNPIVLFLVLAFTMIFTFPEGKKKVKPKFLLTRKKILIACLIALFILLTIFSNYLNTIPEKEKKEFEVLRYTHIGEFYYTAHLKPNVLYEKTELNPSDGVVYTSLLKDLEFFFKYRLETEPSVDFNGNYSVDIYLENPEEWIKQIDFIPEKEFSSAFSFSYRINLTSVKDLIDEIEKETGVRQTCRLVIKPNINVSSEKFSDDFEPSLNVTIQEKKLIFDGFEHKEEGSIKDVKFEDKKLLGFNVSLLKQIVFACTIIDIIAISIIAVYMKEQLDDQLKKYEHVIVNVKELRTAKEVVQLASIEDLIKVAQNIDKFILRAEVESEEGSKHIYYVIDNSIRYEYKP